MNEPARGTREATLRPIVGARHGRPRSPHYLWVVAVRRRFKAHGFERARSDRRAFATYRVAYRATTLSRPRSDGVDRAVTRFALARDARRGDVGVVREERPST